MVYRLTMQKRPFPRKWLRKFMWVIAITFRPSSVVRRLSSVVRPSAVHILIFSSETTGPIATKLWWNGPWVAPFQSCVRCSRLPTKMIAKLKIEKRRDEIKKKSSPLKLLSQSQPSIAEMILGWSPSKLCPAFQTSDQDGRHSRT